MSQSICLVTLHITQAINNVNQTQHQPAWAHRQPQTTGQKGVERAQVGSQRRLGLCDRAWCPRRQETHPDELYQDICLLPLGLLVLLSVSPSPLGGERGKAKWKGISASFSQKEVTQFLEANLGGNS